MNSRSTRSDGVNHLVEMEFVLRDSSCPFVTISDELGCRTDLLELVPVPDDADQLLGFIRVRDASPESVVELAGRSDRVSDLRVLQTFEGELLCTLTLGADCVIQSLRRAGTILQSAIAADGEHRIVVVLPPGRDPDALAETVRDRHPALTVGAVRERPIAASLLTQGSFRTLLGEWLTERQWTVLRLAFANGYFRRPREITQGELAETMGISQETVSQHLRAAQQRLLEVVFEECLTNP